MKTYLSFLVLLIVGTSCSLFSGNDNSREDACDWLPGNRNYTWRIDTVGYWPSELGGLYVFNDTTAFLTGYINAKNGDNLGGLRWDGRAWVKDIYNPLPKFPIGHYGLDAAGDDTLMVSVGYWDLNNGFKSAIGEFNLNTKTWTKHQFETVGRLKSVWTDGKGFYVAVGENGIIYTKETPNSDWVFSRMEDEVDLTEVSGISKTEWYVSTYKGIIGSPNNYKLYRYLDENWITLYDTGQSESSILQLGNSTVITRLKAYRCTETDSLYLFIPGESTYMATSHGVDLSFNEINLKDFYPNQTENFRSGWVFVAHPRNVWMPTPRYGLFHYNGVDVQKITSIPSLPYGDRSHLGLTIQMVFSESGKIWILMETTAQNYILIQGTPL